MLIAETVTVALDALRVNKLRSVLTMLGIIIGVGAVIAVLAMGRGAQQAVNERISSLGTTLLTIVPACTAAAYIAGSPESAWPTLVAAAAGSVSYVAIFIAIGCLTRRAAVWSLAFVFFVERLLGAALTGIAQLSPTWESRAIFVAWIDDAPSRLVRDGIPQGGAAIFRLALVTIVALALAIWRMRHMRMVGASD